MDLNSRESKFRLIDPVDESFIPVERFQGQLWRPSPAAILLRTQLWRRYSLAMLALKHVLEKAREAVYPIGKIKDASPVDVRAVTLVPHYGSDNWISL